MVWPDRHSPLPGIYTPRLARILTTMPHRWDHTAPILQVDFFYIQIHLSDCAMSAHMDSLSKSCETGHAIIYLTASLWMDIGLCPVFHSQRAPCTEPPHVAPLSTHVSLWEGELREQLRGKAVPSKCLGQFILH